MSTSRRRWLTRGVLAAALVGVAVIPAPGALSGTSPSSCRRATCRAQTETVRWSAPLQGQWSAANGLTGTAPAAGAAYAAVGYGTAVVGTGMNISGYAEATGKLTWQTTLTGFAAAASIVSVRAWPGVVTAGIALPGGKRIEAVLDNATGNVLYTFDSALFGGAVAASAATTVIVGDTAVTGYDNRTGRVRWSRPTGAVPQSWRVDAGTLYMTVAAGGYLGLAAVTAVQVINLSMGTERTLRPISGKTFPGRLSDAAGGVLLFTDDSGVTAYSAATGFSLWRISGAIPEGADRAQHRFYLTEGTSLVGVDALTGRVLATVSGGSAMGAAGVMYLVRDGVALGLDQGADGSAWGFDIPLNRVTWTVPGLGYPHFFTDLSGLGGSAAIDGGLVVIAACAQTAPAAPPSPSVSGTSGSAAAGSEAAGSAAAGSAAAGSAAAGSAAAGQGTGTSSAAATPSAAGSPTATATPSRPATPPPVSRPQTCTRPELVALGL